MSILVKKEEETNPAYGKPPSERTVEELLELGFIVINKPCGPSSHEVTSWVKNICGAKKSGHAGTLDPNVSGVLPVALNRATAVLSLLLASEKEYVGRAHGARAQRGRQAPGSRRETEEGNPEMSIDWTFTLFAIALMALCYSVFTQFITSRFGNRTRVKQIQDDMKRINEQYAKAIKSNDEKRLAEAEKEQKTIPALLQESMILQFKPLIFTLPVLLIIPIILRSVFPMFVIHITQALPIFVQNWNNFPNWRDTFGPVGWFWITFVFGGLLIQLIVSGVKKMRGKK